jgi:hypothetical protein
MPKGRCKIKFFKNPRFIKAGKNIIQNLQIVMFSFECFLTKQQLLLTNNKLADPFRWGFSTGLKIPILISSSNSPFNWAFIVLFEVVKQMMLPKYQFLSELFWGMFRGTSEYVSKLISNRFCFYNWDDPVVTRGVEGV